MWGAGCGVWGGGWRVEGVASRVQGSGFRVEGHVVVQIMQYDLHRKRAPCLGHRGQDSGFRVQD